MKILAFDTSSTALSVALLEDENLVAEATVTVKKNHSISLMPTIDFLVAQAGWQPADLERIVVAQGPGSYTGLRVAVATAKTLAYALGIDLVGVSSLQALTDLTADGIVIPIMDARRNNVYVGFYENGQAIVSDHHAAFADVLEHLTDSEKALEKASKFLAQNGEILLTFPNLAHNSVLIDLFNNKLDWKQYGLLDRTHNSFYTQKGFEELFDRIGLSIRREDFTYAQVGQNELSASYEDLPEMVRYDFKNRPFGEVYQYFYALRKEPVTNPERVEPINSNYNKQIQLAYLINGKFEVEPYIFNNQTGENKSTVHHAPEDTKKLRIVIGKVPASIQLSVIVENRLLKIEETNASWYQEDLFMFPEIAEEPYVVVDGAAIAGKEYSVNVNVLNEEEFFPAEEKMMDDLRYEKGLNRLLSLFNFNHQVVFPHVHM